MKSPVSRPATTPYWISSAALPTFPQLQHNLNVDVVVIGGGITGITAAYLIKSAGLTVALVERGHAAQLDTGHTTAHLSYVTDRRLTDLVRHFGNDHARAVWDAGRVAIEQIAATVAAEDIKCGFEQVPGYLHSPFDEKLEDETLRREADMANELGFDAAYLDSVPYMNRPGVRFDRQAKFHPRKYLAGLLDALQGDGSHVFENTEAEEVADNPLRVKAGKHTLSCEYVVIATHTPIAGTSTFLSASLLQTKLAPHTSYAMGGKVPSSKLPDAMFWDTADPYHYLRVDRHEGFDYVILGGEDHKTGQAADTTACFHTLEKTFRALVPDVEITHRWSGQVVETNDGLPYIGETSPSQFVATGFSGNGMTFGTLAGMMARDAALGRQNPWRELFDVHRTKLRGGTWDYLKENKDYLSSSSGIGLRLQRASR